VLVVAVCVAAATLLARSAAGHGKDRPALEWALRVEGVPAAGARAVAALLPVVNAALAVALLAGVLARGLLAPAALAAAGLFAAFLAYLVVLARRQRTDCHCFPGDDPLNAVTIVRAAGLLVGLVVASQVVPASLDALALTYGVLAGLVAGLLLEVLPSAREMLG
jgi:hypothetical protein